MTRLWRVVTAGLLVISRGSLLVFALACVLAPAPVPAGALLRVVGLFWLVPELAVWMLRRAHTATLAIRDDCLVVRAPAGAIDIPIATMMSVVPWRVPLPAPGFSLALRSGERLPEGLAPNDPLALLRALAEAGVSGDVIAPALEHPTLVYGTAKIASRRPFDHALVKFVLFSLVPTLILFRLRQYLVYGGTFGEYYQYGLQAYVLGFAIFWLLYAVYLLLYAAGLRALAEVVSLFAAWSMPAWASRVRRLAETLDRIAYYGGVPALLALRLYPW